MGTIAQHCRPVSDENQCAPRAILHQSLHDAFLCRFVECRRTLIEQHEGTRTQQCSGDTDALCLPFRQSPTLLGARGVESLRQCQHKIGSRHLQNGTHLRFVCLRIGQQQVLSDRSRQQAVALRHISEQISVLCHDGHRRSVLKDKIHRSAHRSNQRQEQTNQGGFSHPRFAENGCDTAGSEIE